MKNSIIILTSLIALSCKAQSPIIPLDDHTIDVIDNAYHKDVNSDLDHYVGTWLYQDGTKSLTITLQKINQYFNGEYFEDMLVGEYKYIENGVEKVNTLLNTPSDLFYHNISASRIIYKGQYPICDSCGLLEKRVKLSFGDPDSSLNYITASIILRYIDDGSTIEKIAAKLITNGSIVLPTPDASTELTVPFGDYLLIKQ